MCGCVFRLVCFFCVLKCKSRNCELDILLFGFQYNQKVPLTEVTSEIKKNIC